MPKELKRTLAYSYSAFNLIHMLEVCELARETLPGLVNTRVGGSGSISDAVYFVASFLGRTAEDFAADGRVAEFGGRQISGWEAARGDVMWLCRRIGAFDTSPSWDALFSQYAAGNDKTAKDNINYLIY